MDNTQHAEAIDKASRALVAAAHDLQQLVYAAIDDRSRHALDVAALSGACAAATIKWASNRRAEVRLGIVDPNTDEPQTFFALDFERPAFAQ